MDLQYLGLVIQYQHYCSNYNLIHYYLDHRTQIHLNKLYILHRYSDLRLHLQQEIDLTQLHLIQMDHQDLGQDMHEVVLSPPYPLVNHFTVKPEETF